MSALSFYYFRHFDCGVYLDLLCYSDIEKKKKISEVSIYQIQSKYNEHINYIWVKEVQLEVSYCQLFCRQLCLLQRKRLKVLAMFPQLNHTAVSAKSCTQN